MTLPQLVIPALIDTISPAMAKLPRPKFALHCACLDMYAVGVKQRETSDKESKNNAVL